MVVGLYRERAGMVRMHEAFTRAQAAEGQGEGVQATLSLAVVAAAAVRLRRSADAGERYSKSIALDCIALHFRSWLHRPRFYRASQADTENSKNVV